MFVYFGICAFCCVWFCFDLFLFVYGSCCAWHVFVFLVLMLMLSCVVGLGCLEVVVESFACLKMLGQCEDEASRAPPHLPPRLKMRQLVSLHPEFSLCWDNLKMGHLVPLQPVVQHEGIFAC